MTNKTDECVGACHFIVDQPNGPISMGTCKFCNNTKEFRNSMPGSGWDRNSQNKNDTDNGNNSKAKPKK